LKQWLYPPLVDAGFPVWRFTIPSDDNWNPAGARGRTPQTYRCTDGYGHDTHPFGDLPTDPGEAWVKLSNGHDGTAANPTLWYLALGGTRYTPHELMDEGHHAPLPPAALLTEMFDTVGIDPTWYFEHMFKRQLDSDGQLVLDCLDPN
jgi:hypothetical protein